MHLLLAMAATSAVLTPPAIRQAALPRYTDYPTSAVRHNQEGSVVYSVFVDPKGKVLRCTPEQIVGTDFTSTVCWRVTRGGFNAAKDRDGKPVHGFYRGMSYFSLPQPGQKSAYPPPFPPEYSFSPKAVAGLLTENRRLAIIVGVDESGNMTDCSAKGPQDDVRLVDAACAQVRAEWKTAALSDKAGVARAYIRAISVEFVPEGATP